MQERNDHFIVYIVNPGRRFPSCSSECVMCLFWHCPCGSKFSISWILRDRAEPVLSDVAESVLVIFGY